jgi:hypothetical protein
LILKLNNESQKLEEFSEEILDFCDNKKYFLYKNKFYGFNELNFLNGQYFPLKKSKMSILKI